MIKKVYTMKSTVEAQDPESMNRDCSCQCNCGCSGCDCYEPHLTTGVIRATINETHGGTHNNNTIQDVINNPN